MGTPTPRKPQRLCRDCQTAWVSGNSLRCSPCAGEHLRKRDNAKRVQRTRRQRQAAKAARAAAAAP